MTASLTFSLRARAAFADLPAPSTSGEGVIACDRDGLGLATVLVRKGRRAELEQRLRECLSIGLPSGPVRAAAGDLALAGIGPGMWLASMERSANAFAARLREAIGSCASVSDQTDGYAVLRLSGPHVRDTLSKLVPIDVHPRTFSVAHVAVSVAAHIGVTLWRLEDRDDGAPVFEVGVYRSMAGSFWRLLSDSAAEFGFQRAALQTPASSGADNVRSARPARTADDSHRSEAETELTGPSA